MRVDGGMEKEGGKKEEGRETTVHTISNKLKTGTTERGKRPKCKRKA